MRQLGKVVADYYLYLLDQRGRITRRIDLPDCLSDDHARELAAAHPHPSGRELWQRDRLVESYDDLKSD